MANHDLRGETHTVERSHFAETDLAGVSILGEPGIESGECPTGDAEIPAAFDAADGRDEDVDHLAAAVQRLRPKINQGGKGLVPLREKQPQLIECDEQSSRAGGFVLGILIELLQEGFSTLSRGRRTCRSGCT